MTSDSHEPKRVRNTDLGDLVRRMRAGERRAIAAAITELERLSTLAPALLREMQPFLGRAFVVGFTGPPGAGKSTLVNAVIAHVRASGRHVGVIAVDPSSPISGGAILGDRIRMTAALDDDGVFVRSLASRGYLGGLSPAAVRVIDAFDAAGFDLVILETVGTGQSEMDVAEVADVRVVITAPGLGDDIQAMKSGLLEIADVLVVNKGDRPARSALQQFQRAPFARRRAGPRAHDDGDDGGGVESPAASDRRRKVKPRARRAAAARPLPHRAGRRRSSPSACAKGAKRPSKGSPTRFLPATLRPRTRPGASWKRPAGPRRRPVGSAGGPRAVRPVAFR
jgi:LAO/AO transport system kinase